MGKHKGITQILFISIVILKVLVSNQFAHGTKFLVDIKPKYRGTIKTIEDGDGDVIDCVNIYKQPAFDDPLLKNHIIQDKPTFSIEYNNENLQTSFVQSWHMFEECPKGTVPIRRVYGHYPPKSPLYIQQTTQLNYTAKVANEIKHENAFVYINEGVYYGSQSIMSIWTPITSQKESSFSHTWLTSGGNDNLNVIQSGWMVNTYNSKAIFFTYWTRDSYQTTGCYDLMCPGFIQTNPKFTPNDIIYNASSYNGRQVEVELKIRQDNVTKNWWLMRNGEIIGYWPDAIFTTLGDGATWIAWGGEIINRHLGGHHTTTQMGSGHFAQEGFKKAAIIRQVGYYNSSIQNMTISKSIHSLTNYINVKTMVTYPDCYSLLKMKNTEQDGFHFFYGGPGYSKEICP